MDHHATQSLVVMPAGELAGMIGAAVETAVTRALDARDPTPTDYLTQREASRMLAVTSATLRAWERRGWLLPRRIGRRVYYLRSDVERAMSGRGEA